MKTINIELSLDEANLIIEALGKLPFIDVYKLIEKIHLQAGNQVKQLNQNKKMK